MGWPVILTEQSQHDLRVIVVFIARDRSERARRFGNELIDQALAIGNFPEMGGTVPELGDLDIGEIVYDFYRIAIQAINTLPCSKN